MYGVITPLLCFSNVLKILHYSSVFNFSQHLHHTLFVFVACIVYSDSSRSDIEGLLIQSALDRAFPNSAQGSPLYTQVFVRANLLIT